MGLHSYIIIGALITILRILKIHLLIIIVNICSNIQGVEVKKGEIMITKVNGTKKHKNISPIKRSSSLLFNNNRGL